jgi:chitinase
MKKTLSLLLCTIFFTSPLFASARTNTTDKPWILSYYVGYQNGYLKPSDVDYSLMTHIVVGAVGPQTKGTLREHWNLSNSTTATTSGRAMARDVVSRAHKEGVKSLLWLGGPNEQDNFFDATSDASRATFVRSLLALVDEVGFDGIDINWEPIRTKDKPQLLSLVQDLRKARPALIITVPVNWIPTDTVNPIDLSWYASLAPFVDRLFIMSYSMAGAWSGWESWHGSALYGDDPDTTPSSVDASVSAYLSAGVPAQKLGMGVGAYATCWEYPVKKPREVLPQGFSSGDIGTLTMRVFQSDYYKKSYEKWDTTARVPYVSFKKKQGAYECGFISFENEKSVRIKAQYALDKKLGGVMLWNLGNDYLPRSSKKFPLLRVVRQTIPK